MKAKTSRCAVAMLVAGCATASAAPMQYEMDLRTYSGMGAGGMMGMLGSMLGKQGASVSKLMDLRLASPTDIPDGYSAEHTVPDGMRIGPRLPLKGERRATGGSGGETTRDDPEGRILIYWGCGETVPKGQPQVIDVKTMSKSMSPEVMAMVRQAQVRKGGGGGMPPGAGSLPPRTVWWPAGDADFKGIPAEASAVGEHVVKASFMNEDIRYTIDGGLDFLEPLNLKASGDLKSPVSLQWDGLARAKGYNLNAVGAAEKEVVIWMAERNKFPMLPASQTTCAIPAGIFEKAQMAMVAEEGVGPTGSFAYPPQEKGKPKKPLIWTARVRVSTSDTALLGLQEAAAGAAGDAAADSVVPGGGTLLKELKGFFGR
ncbi:hypothetical protein B9N43_11850 [Denitratisoma sp. DHT3]|uniref:hypothetical protein n=1 Tax=Denitratisoma sp. DHT3 TaxID=1981880 RepID=UPI0011984A80|nr:hypothetical protein [Denitratisoma sp. DHT3]QDX81885.1 hypothetical protein B9N43_11850 [Denitratisoma sp. DHT3]